MISYMYVPIAGHADLFEMNIAVKICTYSKVNKCIPPTFTSVYLKL